MPGRWQLTLCPVDVDADSTDALAMELGLGEQYKTSVRLVCVVATPMRGS